MVPGVEAAAVRHAAQQAWGETQAAPGWQLRRTPVLPQIWPPPPDGPAVWLCYAERDNTPAVIDIAAPWAQISLAAGGAPVLERLSDTVEWLGPQGIKPLDLNSLKGRLPHASLIDAVHRGDPDGLLARELSQWRALNGCIAAHPAVASRLPPPVA
jgi:hypothetical protein